MEIGNSLKDFCRTPLVFWSVASSIVQTGITDEAIEFIPTHELNIIIITFREKTRTHVKNNKNKNNAGLK